MSPEYEGWESKAELRIGADPAGAERREGQPFCLAIVGNFTGRSAPRERRTAPFLVDRDNIDDAVRHFAPHLDLDFPSYRFALDFAEMEDFHPDVVRNHPEFAAIRAAVGAGVETSEGPNEPPARGNVLDLVLDRMTPEGSPPAGDGAEVELPRNIEEFVRHIVAPHIVPAEGVRRRAREDEAVEAALRLVFHHPAFQALEALWRGVDFATRRVETVPTVRIYLIDATKGDLGADEQRVAELVGDGVEARWSVLLGCFAVSRSEEDVGLLASLAAHGARLGAPWIVDGTPVGLGADGVPSSDESNDGGAAWDAFRASPAAAGAALAWPRFLVRLPYGEGQELCDMSFEEMPEVASEHYLWASAALFCGVVLAQAFVRGGRSALLERAGPIDGLPYHVTRHGDAIHGQPPVERVLDSAEAARLLSDGIMPLVTGGEESVRVAQFRSAARDGRLSADWSQG